MDPYAELGVPRNADAETIKRAYRKRVQKAHPDKGGSKDAFQALQLSYDTLSDPERKKRFDEFGETGQGPDPRQQALAEIAAMFIQLLDQIDPDHTDLHALVLSNINRAIEQHKTSIATHNAKIKKRENAMKRIKKKTQGENVILRMFEADVLQQKNAIARAEREIERGKTMIEMLKDYSYSADAMSVNFSPNMTSFVFRTA
jgi:curved DNA-binding protein CbpA